MLAASGITERAHGFDMDARLRGRGFHHGPHERFRAGVFHGARNLTGFAGYTPLRNDEEGFRHGFPLD